jgi:hypothetical protein
MKKLNQNKKHPKNKTTEAEKPKINNNKNNQTQQYQMSIKLIKRMKTKYRTLQQPKNYNHQFNQMEKMPQIAKKPMTTMNRKTAKTKTNQKNSNKKQKKKQINSK